MGWHPRDIGDLTGRTALVTGATSGIGRYAATTLARHGARVLFAVRDTARGESVARDIQGEARVEHVDLASLDSVRALAERVQEPLHLLVNNAGLMEPPQYRETQDGHELQFGTNHLAHFALTALLLPQLVAAGEARVTTVSSLAHFRGNGAVVEGNPPQTYVPGTAYGHSKLANLLFADELQRRASRAGVALTSTAAHPGIASTGLFADPDGWGGNPVVRYVLPVAMRVVVPGAAGGARPVLYAATEAEPGSYSGPKGPGEVRGPVGGAKRSRHARDEDLAAGLWAVSERMTGTAFDLHP